jgi:hypothetical protein
VHITERIKQIKEIEFTETFGVWQEPGKRDSIQIEHCPIPSLGANSVSEISILRIEGLFLPVSLIQEAIHPLFPVLISFPTRSCMAPYPAEIFDEDRDSSARISARFPAHSQPHDSVYDLNHEIEIPAVSKAKVTNHQHA